MYKSFFLTVLTVFFLGGCAAKHYAVDQAKIIVMRSPQLRFADLGYIKHNKNAIELQLFEAGTLVKTITIDDLICVDDRCLTKGLFNARYLSGHYPSSILKNVILGRPIYDSKDLQETKGGFVQKIDDGSVDIVYSVQDGHIRFEDRQNAILMKISPLNP